MSKKDIHIVLSSSEEFLPYCATTMISILKNISKKYFVHFYILSFDFSEKTKDKINKIKKIKDCNIYFPKINDDFFDNFNGIHLPPHVTKMTYARILIPDILPDIDKVLFIDSDTLVLDDISPLWETELGEYCFAAVEDVGHKKLSMRLWQEEDKYFNAGVLLINSAKLRDIDYLNIIKITCKKNAKKYRICDQDVINDSFRGQIKQLSYKYNFYHDWFMVRTNGAPSNISDYIDSEKSPVVVHFVGQNKPWLSKSNHKYKSEYLKYFKKNPFYKYKFYRYLRYKLYLNEFIHLQFMGMNILTLENNVLEYRFKFLGLPFFVHDKESDKKYLLFKNLYHIFQSKLLSKFYYKYINKNIFKKYKNKFKDKDVVILGSGPTFQNYIPIKDVINIGANGCFKSEKVQPDYLFMQDYSGLTYIDELLNPVYKDINLFFGNLIFDKKPTLALQRKICPIPNNVRNKFNAKQYFIHALPDDGKFKKISEYFDDMGSTIFVCILFALYGGAKKIYLVGCDCTAGHFYNKDASVNMHSMIVNWIKLKLYISNNYPDVEVVSVNPVGLKGVFNDIYQLSE